MRLPSFPPISMCPLCFPGVAHFEGERFTVFNLSEEGLVPCRLTDLRCGDQVWAVGTWSLMSDTKSSTVAVPVCGGGGGGRPLVGIVIN